MRMATGATGPAGSQPLLGHKKTFPSREEAIHSACQVRPSSLSSGGQPHVKANPMASSSGASRGQGLTGLQTDVCVCVCVCACETTVSVSIYLCLCVSLTAPLCVCLYLCMSLCFCACVHLKFTKPQRKVGPQWRLKARFCKTDFQA